MALTRANAETIIVKRLGPMMAVAAMAVTVAGTNADLDDPLAWACRMLGGSTATYSTVTSAELVAVGAAQYDDLFDLAEYRCLKNMQGGFDAVDITVGPESERLSQYAAQVEKMLERLEPKVAALATPWETGYLSQDFAEHGE